MARSCYQQNYLHIVGRYQDKKLISHKWLTLDAFKPSIQRIFFRYRRDFKHFLNTEFEFHQLREITFFCVHNLAQLKLECMENKVLSKLERLKFMYSRLEPELVERMLALAPNLKYLKLKKNSEWEQIKGPNKVYSYVSKEVLPITKFLESNPNIRYLAVNSANLCENSHTLKTSKVALDDLAVFIDYKDDETADHTKMSEFARICRLLNELHALGIYKRLKLYFSYRFKPELIDEVASLNALVKFHNRGTSGPFALSSLQRIEELNVERTDHIKDIEAMAENLVNLKILHIEETDTTSIMPLIKRAKQLEKIQIDRVLGDGLINVTALNRERSKVPTAKTITLYVKEHFFLANKRAMRAIDLDFIKLQRCTSIGWDIDFR